MTSNASKSVEISLSTNCILAVSPALSADLFDEIVTVGAVVPTGINKVVDGRLLFPAESVKAPKGMLISPVVLLPMGGVKITL